MEFQTELGMDLHEKPRIDRVGPPKESLDWGPQAINWKRAPDDIGYVQQSPEEMEVLFHFLAERYEKKTVVITSNLVFSQWDQIFKTPMTTMAAIDRLVHHATILEFTGESIRANAAKKRQC